MDGASPLSPATSGLERDPATSSLERDRDGYRLSCEPGRVDVGQVHAWLSKESYWAAGREREVVEQSIAGSRPYSVYAGDAQVGFARVVTDGATFAWICDVFVDRRHRERGLGSWLVESIIEDLSVAAEPRFVLATKDAHDVYRRCGFLALEGSDRWMVLDKRPTRPTVG